MKVGCFFRKSELPQASDSIVPGEVWEDKATELGRECQEDGETAEYCSFCKGDSSSTQKRVDYKLFQVSDLSKFGWGGYKLWEIWNEQRRTEFAFELNGQSRSTKRAVAR